MSLRTTCFTVPVVASLLASSCERPAPPPSDAKAQAAPGAPAPLPGTAPGAAAPSATAAAPGAPPGAAPATAARPAGTGAAGATNLTAPPAAPPGSTPAAAQLPAGAMTTTPSGLQYAVLKEGEGPTPPPGAKIQVHWTGWLPDGRVFSDTRKGGVPDEFTLHSRDLIKGWVEALSSMKKGEKRKLHVPNGLAYGPQGYHQVVPPRADLDFEIELVSFTPPGGR